LQQAEWRKSREGREGRAQKVEGKEQTTEKAACSTKRAESKYQREQKLKGAEVREEEIERRAETHLTPSCRLLLAGSPIGQEVMSLDPPQHEAMVGASFYGGRRRR
jgi:hypothetical protein